MGERACAGGARRAPPLFTPAGCEQVAELERARAQATERERAQAAEGNVPRQSRRDGSLRVLMRCVVGPAAADHMKKAEAKWW